MNDNALGDLFRAALEWNCLQAIEEESMRTVQQDIDSFHKFASSVVERGDAHVTIDDLFEQWRTERFSEDDLKAIQASLADLRAGLKGKPLAEFKKEFEARHGLQRST